MRKPVSIARTQKEKIWKKKMALSLFRKSKVLLGTRPPGGDRPEPYSHRVMDLKALFSLSSWWYYMHRFPCFLFTIFLASLDLMWLVSHCRKWKWCFVCFLGILARGQWFGFFCDIKTNIRLVWQQLSDVVEGKQAEQFRCLLKKASSVSKSRTRDRWYDIHNDAMAMKIHVSKFAPMDPGT